MGFRFRKSINLGGGFKVNLSKSGVGYSWGTKGIRFTKTAKGKNRTTLSIPGTGLSYVTESGSKRKSSKRNAQKTDTGLAQPSDEETQNAVEPAAEQISAINDPADMPAVDPKKRIKNVLLWVATVFFALMGLIYLTSGGFLTGFLAVAFVALVIPIDSWQAKLKTFIKGKLKIVIAVVLAVLCFFTVPAAEPADTDETVPTAVATEATEVPTTEAPEITTGPTTVAATEPTADAEPTTEPTIEPTTVPTTEPATEPTTEPIKDNGRDYVVNTSTGKFHYPSCSSADDIKASNRWDYHGTRDELIDMDYVPCKRCDP